MEHSKTQQIQWSQHIRMRPGMYIGSLHASGFKQILEYLFEMFLEYKLDAPVFELGFYPANRVTLHVTQINVQSFSGLLPELNKTEQSNYQLGLCTLISLSSNLSLTIHNTSSTIVLSATRGNYQWENTPAQTEESGVAIDFTIDPEIFKDYQLVYDQVNPFLQQFAYLNPDLKIVSEDHSGAEYQRNVFHYPKGIFQQLDMYLSEVHYWDRTNFRFDIEASLNEYSYRIGLHSPNPWFRSARNRTFAGNIETYWGGSLESGIMKGLLLTLKTLAKQKHVRIHANKKSIRTRFAFMAAVTGKEFEYEGSTKRKLGGILIQKDASEIVHKYLMEYYQLNPEKAMSVLKYFCIPEEDESL